jgi:hypothetical protein
MSKHQTKKRAVAKTPAQKDLKLRILADIREHLAVYGRTNWKFICEAPDYAPIIGEQAGPSGKRKFMRWVNSVATPLRPDKTRPHEAGGIAAGAMTEARKRARLAAQKNIPAPPSPAYMLRKGPKAEETVNLLAELNRLWWDGMLLRTESMEADEDAPNGERIANVRKFSASIKRRLQVVDTTMRVQSEIWDLRYQKKFYDEIVDIVVNELADQPEKQKVVIERIAKLNETAGMTTFVDRE